MLEDGRVQVLCYTKYKEMIRLSGKAHPVAGEEQRKWIDTIFEEQPYLANVYPGDTREIDIIFCIDNAQIEYFNLGVHPIFRETCTLGDVIIEEKGYHITDACIGCGTVCGELSAAVYRRGNAVYYPAESLSALRKLL